MDAHALEFVKGTDMPAHLASSSTPGYQVCERFNLPLGTSQAKPVSLTFVVAQDGTVTFDQTLQNARYRAATRCPGWKLGKIEMNKRVKPWRQKRWRGYFAAPAKTTDRGGSGLRAGN